MVVVIDSTDLDLGKHAYSQMKDFGVDPEVVYEDALNIPRVISSREDRYFLVAFDTGHRFSTQIVGKILDLEESKHVAKVFVEKDGESQELFEKKSRRSIREKSEELAEKVD